jgi:hypothetical protein
VKRLFELTQAKKLANVMVVASLVLFAFSYATYRFEWFERWQGLALGGIWRSGNYLPFLFALGLGVVLLIVGITTHIICNNISQLMKDYDDELH